MQTEEPYAALNCAEGNAPKGQRATVPMEADELFDDEAALFATGKGRTAHSDNTEGAATDVQLRRIVKSAAVAERPPRRL